MTTARGIRNNNPGNIRHGEQWQGLSPLQDDPAFCQFISMEYGIRALVVLLKTYRTKHRLTTVREIISRWAPPSENNTEAYIAAVCDGWVLPDEQLPDTRDTYLFLAQRIARHENGWADYQKISPQQWRDGLALAGFPEGAAAPAAEEPQPEPQQEKPAVIPPVVAPSVLGSIISAAAGPLVELVADLFRGHGTKTSTRNAEIIEKVGPVLVETAKAVTKDPTIEGATQKVIEDPQYREEFRAAVAKDLDKLVGMIERLNKIDEDSRDRAAARAQKEHTDFAMFLIARQFWLYAAMAGVTAAALLVALALKADGQVVVGLVVLFTALANSAKDKWGTMIEYRFGSSEGSRLKDAVIAEQQRK